MKIRAEKIRPLFVPAVSVESDIKRIVNGPMAPSRNRFGKKSIKLDSKMPMRMSGKFTRYGSIHTASQGVIAVQRPAVKQSEYKPAG